MPKRTDIKKILIIGSGPIVIGQGSEYDHAAAEASKALRKEGYETVIVNSNPAAISTNQEAADRVYIEPLTTDTLKKIIEKEKPSAILPVFGGQTALYLASELDKAGILNNYGVKLIGMDDHGVSRFGDPALYKETTQTSCVPTTKSSIAASIENGMQVLKELGLPLVIKPTFTPGGAGSGISYNTEEFVQMLAFALKMSPTGQVLIEQPMLGWKQIEIVVMRDSLDKSIAVASIENIDPVGVHPANSAAVIPPQTLSKNTLDNLEAIAQKITSGFAITGAATVRCGVGSNDEIAVLGISPVVGRSATLAGKVTGFPVAGTAAKLAVGLTLTEITDTCAPLDNRVVVKMPRFAFKKFPDADTSLGTSAKAVGEAIAVGATFIEALQKSIRSLDAGRLGVGSDNYDPSEPGSELIHQKLTIPNEDRLVYIRHAASQGMSVGEISEMTGINKWFVENIAGLIEFEKKLSGKSLVNVAAGVLEEAKKLGYSDAQLAVMLETDEEQIRVRRKVLGLQSKAGSIGGACYLSYGRTEGTCSPADSRKILILAGGPSRVGQGAEFDWSVVQASKAVSEEQLCSIVVNCDPNAPSTDASNSDKLYISPLTVEDVTEIIDREKPDEIMASFGGRTAIALGRLLEKTGVKMLGIPAKSIDRLMNQKSFGDLLRKLGLHQMENETAESVGDALQKAEKLGYPLLVKPSRMHFGRDRMIIYDAEELTSYVKSELEAAPESGIVIYKFLEDATEVTVDAVADGENVIICGVMEHIEQAGVHAGDSACSLPPHSLSESIVSEIKKQTRTLAEGIGVRGLLSVRFAAKDGQAYVLAINPRASRTIPFVSKATGVNWPAVAAKVLLGKSLKDQGITEDPTPKHISVKEAVFPFVRFPGADVVLGPDMKSTGQVMGINATFGSAYIKAQIAAEQNLPKEGNVFLSLADRDKSDLPELAKRLKAMGYEIIATKGTAKALRDAGVDAKVISKIAEGRPDAIDLIKNGDIDLIINTRSGKKPRSHEITIRGAVIARGIPIITTIAGAKATVFGMETVRSHGGAVRSLDEYEG